MIRVWNLLRMKLVLIVVSLPNLREFWSLVDQFKALLPLKSGKRSSRTREVEKLIRPGSSPPHETSIDITDSSVYSNQQSKNITSDIIALSWSRNVILALRTSNHNSQMSMLREEDDRWSSRQQQASQPPPLCCLLLLFLDNAVKFNGKKKKYYWMVFFRDRCQGTPGVSVESYRARAFFLCWEYVSFLKVSFWRDGRLLKDIYRDCNVDICICIPSVFYFEVVIDGELIGRV